MGVKRLLWMVAAVLLQSARGETKLVPHAVRLASGRTVTLNLPDGFAVDVAMEGLRRVRFMAKAPDGRIFATDMDSLADNTRGKVYLLDGWDETTHRFARVVPYLEHLRNPNNVAFWTDGAGQSWMYLALTDRLVRYPYATGSMHVEGVPQVLAQYPDYGLNYKYGGWHLTRTVAVANLQGRAQLYVTVGSSCNACREKEAIRATVSVMEMDGSKARVIGRGLRNAVGLVVVPDVDGGAIFGTNMGADHLGEHAPEDTFFKLDSARAAEGAVREFGWPTCYFEGGVAHADRLVSDPQPGDHLFPPAPVGPPPEQVDCGGVQPAYTTFAAHSSPLGAAWFGAESTRLKRSFLVALHGPMRPKNDAGYRLVRFSPDHRRPEDFMTGFEATGARPCGILATGPDSFLLTDDKGGVVYFVHPVAR